MKNLNIYYWVSIALVLFFLIPGSIMNVMKTQEWVDVFMQLGYPEYLLPFLGVAKLAGCIALVLPNFKRLKEWAYAGFFFDFLWEFGLSSALEIMERFSEPTRSFWITRILNVLNWFLTPHPEWLKLVINGN